MRVRDEDIDKALELALRKQMDRQIALEDEELIVILAAAA